MMLFDTRRLTCQLFAFVLLLSGMATVAAQPRDAEYSDWPEKTRISGRVIVSNGLQEHAGMDRLLSRIAESKKVVVIADKIQGEGTWWRRQLKNAVGSQGQFGVINVLFSSDVKVPPTVTVDNLPVLLGDRFQLLNEADCVLVESAAKIPHEIVMKLVGQADTVVLEGNQGVKAGKQSMEFVGVELASAGWNLIPDTVIAFSTSPLKTDLQDRVLKFAATYGPLVGLVVPEGTGVMLSGRRLTCLGSGKVTALVPKSEVSAEHRQQISGTGSRRRPLSRSVIDLTQWRRLAIDRQLPQFPSEKPPVPNVEAGTLLIVGGGRSPRGLMNRFVELAGGAKKAKLVYVPCSEDDEVSARQSVVAAWKRMGVQHATFIHTKDRHKADTDQEFLASLKDATGLYFGGGRQWNFADSYYGTTAHQLMKDVLKRGGVIAGSSAGASIQARYLARSTPIGNFDIMAPGYERGGLGFIGGVAIDQHFSQRGRQKDMAKLMKTYPQLLGIGLDEGTAIEVKESTAKVSGNGRAFFYSSADRGEGSETDSADAAFVALPAGSIYNLADRTVVVNAADGS